MKLRKIGSTALVLVVAACSSDGMGPRGVAKGKVGLTFGVLGALPSAGAGESGSASARLESSLRPSFATSRISGDTLVLAAGTDTMRLTAVQLTIEEIELERDGQSVDCSSDSTSTSGASLRRGRGSVDDTDDDSSGGDSRSRSSDDCEDHIGGPVLVDLNMTGTGTSQITVPAVLGVYDTLEFEFDVADESNSAHAAYRAAHPEMANASARLVGTFNGAPFELKLDSQLKYEVALTMPLVVSDSSTGFELAINIDVGAWLTRSNGTLINPITICSLGSGCTDREIIENNMDNARVRADGRRRGRDD